MAIPVSLIAELAERLDRAERERTEIEALTAEYPDLTAADGYAIQQRLVEIHQGRGARVIGMKTGLTSKAKQDAMGVHEPIFGCLLSDMPIQLGATIDALIHPRVEPEIAFIMARDLQGPGVTPADVLNATAGVLPVLEVIDSRYQDFNFTLADVIADNASASRLALGSERHSPSGIDIAEVEVRFEKNGEIIDRGLGADVLGHPAAAVAWLANAIAPYGRSLRADDLVLPGALCNAHSIAYGDQFRAIFTGLGEVSLHCL